MNPFCDRCGFRISTECDCEISQGPLQMPEPSLFVFHRPDPTMKKATPDSHPWRNAGTAGATRAAIDDAVAQAKAERDMVNHPPHYTQGNIECIDAIRAALGDEGLVAYCRGAAIKYLWRMGKKGDAVQDLEKAIWYITKAVEVQREAK